MFVAACDVLAGAYKCCVAHSSDAISSPCLLAQIPGHGLVSLTMCRQLMQWMPDRALDNKATDEEKRASKFAQVYRPLG